MSRILSELHKQRLSISSRNRGAWKGENASYEAIHMWVRKHWGKANHCEVCSGENARRYDWCNWGKEYKRVRGDWGQLCPSCHKKYDIALIRERIYGADACVNGHIRTANNTSINNRGHKVCKICGAAHQRRWKLGKNKAVH